MIRSKIYGPEEMKELSRAESSKEEQGRVAEEKERKKLWKLWLSEREREKVRTFFFRSCLGLEREKVRT